MKIIFTIWCTEDYYDIVGIDKLVNSLKYFHPTIPVEVVKTTPKQAGDIYERHPVMMKPYSTINFFDNYDLVIHMDSDCTITGPLDEIFEGEYDLACVRNYTHNGSCGITPPQECIVPINLTIDTFMNAGFVSIKNKEFVNDWLLGPYKSTWDGDDQNELNRIINTNKYKVKILDDYNTNVTYGVSNCWGHNTHWDSWKTLYVEDDILYINNQLNQKIKVKILHFAGGKESRSRVFKGQNMREWLLNWVSPEVKEFILKITN